jgi:hypothetical protein
VNLVDTSDSGQASLSSRVSATDRPGVEELFHRSAPPRLSDISPLAKSRHQGSDDISLDSSSSDGPAIATWMRDVKRCALDSSGKARQAGREPSSTAPPRGKVTIAGARAQVALSVCSDFASLTTLRAGLQQEAAVKPMLDDLVE